MSESATPRTDAAPRLTPDEINRRIALACGWKDVEKCKFPYSDRKGRLVGTLDGNVFNPISNYLASLDACAEFEAKLDEKAELFYMTRLVEAMALSGTIGTKKDRTYRASAKQRCHAFCLLRGLIKDGEEWPE